MRTAIVFLLSALVVGPLSAQDKDADGAYENSELDLKFAGVYGWKRTVASGNSAWTELARYSEPAFDADVVLLVRDNPYSSISALRSALQTEFKAAGGNVKPGQQAITESKLKDAQMRGGLNLPAVDVEGALSRITKAGKKRELGFLSRTYFGKNRLFRVHCTARRSRWKRVGDLMNRAARSLVVSSQQEKVVSGSPFTSLRGKYQLTVPADFATILPKRGSRRDMQFWNSATGVNVVMWAYPFDGVLIDHTEELVDFYGGAIKMEAEETKLMGGTGFRATVTRDNKITLIAGLVKNDRVYRIHTSGTKANLAEMKRAHAAFEKSFRTTK